MSKGRELVESIIAACATLQNCPDEYLDIYVSRQLDESSLTLIDEALHGIADYYESGEYHQDIAMEDSDD